MVASITGELLPTDELLTATENKLNSSIYLANEADSLNETISVLSKRGITTSNISGIDKLPTSSTAQRDVFVSIKGNDSTANGSLNSPFATISKACEYIKENSDYLGDWRVVITEGRYTISDTIYLDYATLGSAASVTFTADNDASVILSNATPIDMTKATAVNESAKSRLPQATANSIVQVDLNAQGITETTPYSAVSYSDKRTAATQVIIDDVMHAPARWPNNGYATVNECKNDGSNGNGLAFTATDSSANAAQWINADNALINGFFDSNDWRYDIIEMADYDANTGVITSASNPPVTMGSIKAPRRFFVENLLEELDAPGEWYIDENNILYIYPTSDNASVYVTTTSNPIFRVSNYNNISFENITFNGIFEDAVQMEYAQNCSVKNCTFKNIGGTGVSMNYCKNSGISASDFFYIGNNAIKILETPKTAITMNSNGAYVTDCKIINFAMYSRNGSSAAIYTVETFGTKISHNEISDSAWSAIVMDQPIECTIEFNEVSNVVKEYGDAGAIYSGMSYISQGNKIYNNYIHDIIPYNESIDSYTVGVYIDDMSSGFDISENVINRAPIGILLGGGKNLIASNNIVMTGNVAKSLDPINADERGLEWAADRAYIMRDELITYSIYYPKFAQRYSHVTGENYIGANVIAPTNNTVTNNFYYDDKCATEHIYDSWYESGYNNTCYGNYKYGTKVLDKISYGSPFVDEANGDYTMKSDSVITARIPDFKTIPFGDIGLLTER